MQGCFSLAEQCWHSTKASSAPQLWKQIGWGCIRNWEGTQQGKLTPIDQRDIPCQTISCIEIKAGERREEGHLESWHLPSYIGVVHNEALLSWILLNICLLWWQVILVASSELIPPHFALLAYTHSFTLPIKIPSSQPTSLCTSILPIHSPNALMAEWCFAVYWD